VKKIFSILFVLVLVVSLGLVTAAPVLAGTIIYVPDDYPTIQEAIDAASPGDTIMVAAGEYDVFQVIEKTNISIIGAEGATVTTANLITALPVVGDAWVMAAVYESENINIEGIDFDGTGINGKPVAVGIAYVDSTGRIADLTIENVIATELGAGVAIIGHVGASTVEIIGATISDNGGVGVGAGIYVCGGSTLEAHFNSIIGNSEFGLLNDGGGTVDATRNWWGHKSGPQHLTKNLLGMGNAVFGDVDFKPWLGAADIVTKTITGFGIVNATKEADMEVVVNGTATVTIARYPSNPHPEAPVYGTLASFDLLAEEEWVELKDIFRDVYVTNTTDETEMKIKLYYTDAQARGFNETSLRPFWSNDDDWVACSDSGVNTTDITINNIKYSGYMWATINNTTTPSLAALNGTPWGGYGHPTEKEGICFIATAAYGTETAKEIDILREFRNEVLLPNSLGARFVSLYYQISPPIANFISRHEILTRLVRLGFVDPIAKILNWSHSLWSARVAQ
jgi:hypothetical protein